MTEKHIRIVTGEEAKQHLGDRELIQLTNRVNKIEVTETVGYERHVAALRIHELVTAGKAEYAQVRRIDPAFPFIEHMKGLREIGHIAIAKDGDKTVGMAGFEFCGTDSQSGKNVFEMRRIAVQKTYEAQGIGSQLHTAMFEQVRNVDPNALILVESQNPKVSSQCRKMGYKPCTLAEGVRLKFGEAEKNEWLSYYEKNGGEFFVFDPSEEKTDSH